MFLVRMRAILEKGVWGISQTLWLKFSAKPVELAYQISMKVLPPKKISFSSFNQWLKVKIPGYNYTLPLPIFHSDAEMALNTV